MSNKKLLPCPFCGFLHNLSPRPTQWENGLWVYQCGRCGANSPPTSIKNELDNIWNGRHQPLEALYYPGEQVIYMNKIAEDYVNLQLKYNKLLAFITRLASQTQIKLDAETIYNARCLLKELGEYERP